MSAVLGLGSVFCGCQMNLFALEQIVQHPEGKGFGVTLTFIQFAFIAFCAFWENVNWSAVFGRHNSTSSASGGAADVNRQNETRNNGDVKKPKGENEEVVPPPPYSGWMRQRHLSFGWLVLMAFIFWTVSLINNLVFRYHISVPLHTVFRSSSLIANIVVGFVLFGRRYTKAQVVCAIAVTVGLTSLTLATSADMMKKGKGDGSSQSASQNASTTAAGTGGGGGATSTARTDPTDVEQYALWVQGVALLTVSVVLSAALGLVQDRMYTEAKTRMPKGTPRWKEALFYSHTMTLPLFGIFYYRDIATNLSNVSPDLYVPILINITSQYVCIRGVYTLTDVTSAFTMTLVITMRKFFSLIISVLYFGHAAHFELTHWVSMALTVAGASAYVFLPGTKPQVAASHSPSSGRKTKKD